MQRRRRALFTVIEILAGGALLLLLLYLARPLALRILRPAILDQAVRDLSEKEKRELYDRLARQSGTLFDVSPDPEVARLAKRNLEVPYKGAEVRTNNAGLRSSRPFAPRSPDVFRIVCLGDSFVFGEAGVEEDRFGDQMQRFYATEEVRIGGRRIEVYSIGLPSWTLVQEAAYLTQKLSAYDPDLILVLTTANDIGDAYGVTGAGVMTTRFSPEHRAWGSAVFSNQQRLAFGGGEYTALTTDLSPEARARWRKGMEALRRLVDLQEGRGGHTLLAVLEFTTDRYFLEIYKSQLAAAGIEAPVLFTDFFSSPETRLPHDGHPNAAGHAILAHHFIHGLDALGWVAVDDDALPPLDPRLSLDLAHPPDPELLAALRRAYVDEHLQSSIDFTRLSGEEAMGFLGGILLQRRAAGEAHPAPWASVRSAFLLRRDPESRQVEVEIEVPPRPELLPMELVLALDGETVLREHVESPGVRLLRAPLPPSPVTDGVVEVRLETPSYFSAIADQRMKSFRLLRARVR
ncbi:MAG: SGNH/GDSL hydrolase family protein [Myxococcota bacterium]